MRQVGVMIACAASVIAVTVAGCDSNNCNDQNPCDEHGHPLIWAPYIIPAYGIYGRPGYRPPRTVAPGAPGYLPTFQGKPPTYNPPRPVPPPTLGQTRVNAPKSKAPASNAPEPAPKPAPTKAK